MKQLLKYAFCLLAFSGANSSWGQYTSPFNKLPLDTVDNEYHFIVSGHFYGNRFNKTHLPTNTLLANLDWINTSDAQMVVCLGDLFKDIQNELSTYDTYLFQPLKIPLVNTVGNHDLSGNIYQENYGETTFYFELGGDIHLILDSEKDNGDIVNEQLKLLKEVAEKAKNPNCHNVFIYAHRTLWKDDYEALDGLFTDNTQSIGGTNFGEDVRPLLKEMGQDANLYWFAGSLGTAPASFFHFKDEDCNLTFIATAIRGLQRDAVLVVNVDGDGEVSFETKSFTGQEVQPLETYDVDFWQSEVGEEPFNWKLIPYYIELMVTHRYFWYGIGFTLFGFVVLLAIKKRRNRKRPKVSYQSK